MKETPSKNKRFTRLRKPNTLFLLAFFGSLAIHFSAYVNMKFFAQEVDTDQNRRKDKVKITYVEKKKTPPKKKKNVQPKKIVEQRMKKTKRPKDPKFLGAQDHIAKEETKAKNPNTMAKNTGPKGNSMQQKTLKFSTAPKKPQEKKEKTTDKKGKGKLKFSRENNDTIKDLMPSAQELYGQMDAGYQDFIEDDLKESNVIDLNTSNFRFLGYVTHLRQAIQMTWTYPQAAAYRGLEGKVGLKFQINKDGTTEKVQVVESSGHSILDNAIVSAIKLASPFAPLPKDVPGEFKVFAGTFYYTMGNMFRAH